MKFGMLIATLKMHGAIPPLPNSSLWHGCLLVKKKGNVAFFLVYLVDVYGTEHNFH
jgi:hypothetical protein